MGAGCAIFLGARGRSWTGRCMWGAQRIDEGMCALERQRATAAICLSGYRGHRSLVSSPAGRAGYHSVKFGRPRLNTLPTPACTRTPTLDLNPP